MHSYKKKQKTEKHRKVHKVVGFVLGDGKWRERSMKADGDEEKEGMRCG